MKVGYGTVIVDCSIGKNTIIWHHCNLFRCKIGKNCTIGSFVEVGEDVKIGNNCKIEAYAFIPKGVTIGNKVFIGPHVVFTNDKFPRAQGEWKLSKTVVQDGASIGANSTIMSGIVIGAESMIGAGSIITRDVEPKALVYGQKAEKRGTVH